SEMCISARAEPVRGPELEPAPEPELEPAPEPELEPAPEPEPEPAPKPVQESQPRAVTEATYIAAPKVEERVIYMERRGPGWGWVVAALLAGAAIGYFLPGVVDRFTPSESQPSAQEVIVKAPQSDPLNVSVTPAVTVASVQEDGVTTDSQVDDAVDDEEIVEPVITEVIDGRTYLTTIAKRYYGSSDFWSYIYEENKEKLGHPDKVRSGTIIVVPPKSKYNIDAGDPTSVKAAKELQAEIYARF
ncbi:MAG: hypothetical protein K2L81_04120, partial [Muribaculaceae bacterium]|nr:hypothetical protein [Muribaculaceae bacterium]